MASALTPNFARISAGCLLLTMRNLLENLAAHKKQQKDKAKLEAAAKKRADKESTGEHVGGKLKQKPTPGCTKKPNPKVKTAKSKPILVADEPLDRAQLLLAAGCSTNAKRVRAQIP
jgi:hypothetical protein